MATDRVLLKEMQAGALTGKSAADPITAVDLAHRSEAHWVKPSDENAATGMAETTIWPFHTINRKVARIALTTNVTVATDNTDYILLTLRSRDAAGANGAVLATWNSHGGAQGALTALVPAAMANLRVNSDAEVNAGYSITATLAKTAAGKVVPMGFLISIYADPIGP